MYSFHDLKLLRFGLKENPLFFHALKLYFSIKRLRKQEPWFEVSSESSPRRASTASRIALTSLKKNDACRLFKLLNIKEEAKRYMFGNKRNSCFGMGIAVYKDRQLLQDTRYKLYNYYHLSKNKLNPGRHLEKIAGELRLNTCRIRRDIRRFGKIRMSAVDLYEQGERSLKIYYGPFATDALFTIYSDLLTNKSIKTYKECWKKGWLPPKVMLVIRYQKNDAWSVRTDFPVDTSDVKKHLRHFDKTGAARKLYQALVPVANIIRISYICIDLDKRPRTQFYFLVL
ncbi:MAG: hypothetical protein PHH75_06520 [Candidatus Omnitrophica bacterium]|nr:hypothetical protein [Candidatus Omnitrophota bacterium]MDD5574815.1 hypothetical protein [Candidatus Omnitrophota bacterium]